MSRPNRLWFKFAAMIVIVPVAVTAYETGPDPRVTGAPGDNPTACLRSGCHQGTLNMGAGSVSILAGGTTYTPGVRQRLQVQISDPIKAKFGFQLSARLASDLVNGQAGSFAPTDAFTQVKCDDFSIQTGANPCPASKPVQFAEHTIDGYKDSTKETYTYSLDWTPPTTNAGAITLYAAGNAVSGALVPTGANVYTTKITLTPAGASAVPVITSVENGATFQALPLAPNMYITIKGTNLASVTRTWSAPDFDGLKLPVSLSGTSVTVNGTPAFVLYASPTQINVITPDISATGAGIPVVVTAAGVSSVAFSIAMQRGAPSFFMLDARHIVATRVDGSAVTPTTPAKRGDTVVFYGTGFGPTAPPMAGGLVTDRVYALDPMPKITIGNIFVPLTFAGLVPPFAQLYQFNVDLPATLPTGDQPVVAVAQGVSSAPALLTLQ